MGRVYQTKPTQIQLGLLQFHSGEVNTYDFDVEYIVKRPYGSNNTHLTKNQMVCVYGVIHFPDGNTYKHSDKLTYTDEVELAKIELSQPIEPDKEFEILRKY